MLQVRTNAVYVMNRRLEYSFQRLGITGKKQGAPRLPILYAKPHGWSFLTRINISLLSPLLHHLFCNFKHLRLHPVNISKKMELKTPSLKELASAISSQSSIVNEFLEKNALPQPSFAPYGLRNWEDADGEVQAARMQLIEAATDILHLAMGPSEYIKFNALTARPHSSLGVPEIFQK